jgi:hypothetical protein
MSQFILQPDVYKTGHRNNLLGLLEDVWVRNTHLGSGAYYLLSGFGNYNGGVRFFSTFKRHVDSGGRVVSFFGASTSQRLTSKQLVERLLNCGCKVYLINRKRIFHTKCYGSTAESGDNLVVTSGNFTGVGMSQNVESAIYLDPEITRSIQFHWAELERSILRQNWEIYTPTLDDTTAPGWTLLFDEYKERMSLDETQFMTMVLTLGHSDTARINADPGTRAAKGTQYFWLSKDCYDFFPPLTILNERGNKTTNSCLINLHYVDLGIIDKESRVTFETGNNVDFRLGTPRYRYTKITQPGDLAVISRISEYDYEIKIVHQATREYDLLRPYATTFIGHRDKRIGYLSNEKLEELLNIQLPTREEFRRMSITH